MEVKRKIGSKSTFLSGFGGPGGFDPKVMCTIETSSSVQFILHIEKSNGYMVMEIWESK